MSSLKWRKKFAPMQGHCREADETKKVFFSDGIRYADLSKRKRRPLIG